MQKVKFTLILTSLFAETEILGGMLMCSTLVCINRDVFWLLFIQHYNLGDGFFGVVSPRLDVHLEDKAALYSNHWKYYTRILLSSECSDWLGCWGKHMKASCFKELSEFQKV